MMAKSPSKKWYILAAGLFVIGIVIILWGVLGGVSNLFDLSTEFNVPGSAVVHVVEPARYKVFLMNSTVSDGSFRSSGSSLPPGLVIDVVRKSDSQKLTLTQDTAESFSIGSRSGSSLFAFEAGQAGDYVVRGQYAAGAGNSPVVLGVGKGLNPRQLIRIIATSIAGSILSLAAFVIVGVSLILRFAAKNKTRNQISSG